MEPKLAIIGGGIAGLSAGCYARMNGYAPHIYELHDKPGGLCTSWRRGEYVFDGCLEWLVGTAPKSGFNHIWRELGVLGNEQRIVHHDALLRYEGRDGRSLSLYSDPARLRAHLTELSPKDAPRIDQLVRTIEHFRSFQPMLDRPHGWKELWEQAQKLLEMASVAPDFLRYGKTSVHDFAARFEEPFLREALSGIFDMPDFPFIGMVATLAWQANGDAGYPIGGSLAFAQGIERRYRQLGGAISYGARVRRIVVEGDRAVGVELSDGRVEHADAVISAADGHSTVFELLGGRYLDHELRQRYGLLPRFPSLVRISLGVARDLSREPHSVSVPLAEPIRVAGRAKTRMIIQHYACDPTLAPAGKTVVNVSFPSSYDAWRTLHEATPELYAAEKERIARETIAAIDRRIPGFAGAVEEIDVATPLTYERFTGNWEGSMEGWLLTTQSMTVRMSDSLPGLTGLRMIGQWLQPGGGVPTAAWGGRNVIRALCHERGVDFRADLAP